MLKTIFKVFPATLPFALSHLPAAALAKAGPRLALATFREAASRVPAYRQLLAEQRVDPATIRSPAAFRQLPVIDKAGYLEAHPLEALCRDGSLEAGHRDYPLLRQAEPEESLPRIRLFPYQAPEIFDPRSIKQRYRPVTGDSGS